MDVESNYAPIYTIHYSQISVWAAFHGRHRHGAV